MNILVLTSIYPQEDDELNSGVTPVVKYFCEEWAKQGHKILVIHNSSRYPKILYMIPKKFRKKINSKFGIVLPNKEQSSEINGSDNGVISYRLPLLKIIPKRFYTIKQVEKQFDKIIEILDSERFHPDIAVGHWENPQIPLLHMIKDRWNIKTALVFHGLVYLNQKRYQGFIKAKVENIDVIGARSKGISAEVKRILSLDKEPFICYSGIANEYINQCDSKTTNFYHKESNSYLFVGRLIERKNVNSIISALNKLYGNSEFVLNIIGEGAEKKNLLALSNDLDLSESIHFLGYKHRNEVIEVMKTTEVFIMISDNETFGLVYIEAMAQGCIVIASRNGGMDGIIIDGFNGFLCEQGNENELRDICMKIKNMTLRDKEKISSNAINTSQNYSDSKMAEDYLNNILNG